MYTIEILDINNQKDLIEYEKAFYTAWGEVKNKKWEIINNERIRIQYKYEDQLIYIVRVNNMITTGLVYNTNMDIPLRLEEIGFHINKQEKGLCEQLVLFSNADLITKHNISLIEAVIELRKFAFNDLRNRGYNKSLASSNKKMAYRYERIFGMQILDTKHHEGEDKYLLLENF